MSLKRLCVAVALFLATLSPAPAFEWNVFLGPWNIIGPFPKDSADDVGLDKDYLGTEPNADPAATVKCGEETLGWKPYEGNVLDFDAAFYPGKANNDSVAYALTTFKCPTQQQAVLAIGADDGVRAWLNGELVVDHPVRTCVFLDAVRTNVALLAGDNTLLLKVENARGAWAALARLLPPGVEKPLVTFAWDGIPGFLEFQVPDLTVEFLNEKSDIVATHHVSGHRSPNYDRPISPLYATEPKPMPTSVRIRFEGEGAPAFEKTVPWPETRMGTVAVDAEGHVKLAGTVIDIETRKPIEGARFAHVGDALPEKTDANGEFVLTHLKSLVTRLSVMAPGYRVKEWQLLYPPSGPVRITMHAGGRTLAGRVTDESGTPLANARIRISQRSAPIPDITDADGKFVIAGLDEDSSRVYPVVERDGFVPLAQFSQELSPTGITEAVYRMKPAATVKGRVTAKADGRPLKGVRVLSGTDRFGSNSGLASVTTDEDGRYRLTSAQPGDTILHAIAPDFAPVQKILPTEAGKEYQQDFELDPGQNVTGRVIDPDGKPVAGARLISDTWCGFRVFDREASSDKGGRYVLPNMPTSAVTVHAICRDFVSQRKLQLRGGETWDIVLAPVISHTIRVRLSDTNRLPSDVEVLRGARSSGRDRIHWWPKGSLNADWDAKTATLTAKPSEDEPYSIFYRFRAPGCADAVVGLPTNPTSASETEIILTPAPVLRGRVLSAETGEPVPDVTVALLATNDELRCEGDSTIRDFQGPSATSKADGTFELTQSAESEFDLALVKTGAGFCYVPDGAPLFAGGEAELPFPAAGAVEGRVIEAGQPVPGETLSVAFYATERTPWQGPFQYSANAKCDGDGRYAFSGLGPGRYRLLRSRSFGADGRSWMVMYAQNEDVTVLPGQTTRHDLVRPAGPTVRGRTLDRDGKALPGTIVQLRMAKDPNGNFEAVQCDADGAFAISNVPPGEYQIEAQHYVRLPDGQRGFGDVNERVQKKANVSGDLSVDLTLLPGSRGRGGPEGELLAAGGIPPSFVAKPINAETEFVLAEQLGKVVAVDFWATWCGPCMAIMPETKALWEKVRTNKDVALITISLDNDEEKLRSVMKEKDLTFPVVFSGQGWQDSIAQSFGVRGIPSSFVIGRDGRFVTQQIHGSELEAAMEKALAMPFDATLTNRAQLARLQVTARFKEDASSVPDVSLALAALAPDGSVAREETLPMSPGSTQLLWSYPRSATGGTLRVVASVPWGDTQTNEIRVAQSVEATTFEFASPRRIRGRLVVNGTNPAPGLCVRAISLERMMRATTNRADGRFDIPVTPGSYFVAVEGNETYAAGPQPAEVEVFADKDPEELTLAVYPAITVHGRALDLEGKPVAEAEVFTTMRENVRTDAEGRFVVGGVADGGPAHLFARKDKVYGILQIEAAATNVTYEVRIGQKPEALIASLAPGAKLPPIRATPLSGGEPILWQAPTNGPTLIVFCPLWHPQGRDLLTRAAEKARRDGINLAAFSTDWTAASAQKQLDAIPDHPEVLYAGPGGVELDKAWNYAGRARAYLVAANGRFASAPPAGELP